MLGRRLYKTKLCLLYQRGRCSRQNCNFAHGDAELRRSGGSFNGRRDFRSGDLRDKLDRRHSPHRRYSPAREGRGHHSFQNQKQISYDKGSSLSRSPVRRSDRKRRKKQHVEGNSNASYDSRASGSPEVRREENSPSHSDNEELQEQLQQIQLDIKELDDHNSQLEISLREKVDEERKLNARISDLESQLTKEQDNFKRSAAKIKKFVEVHDRYIKTKEELKRLESRMQKYGHDLSLDAIKTGSIEGQSVDNVFSDVEHNDGYPKSLRDDELSTKDLLSRKKAITYLAPSVETTLGELKRWDKQSEMIIRSGKSSGVERPTHSLENIINVPETLKTVTKGKPSADEHRQKRGRSGSAYTARWDKGKASGVRQSLRSTSVAANAVDELNDANEINDKYEAVEALKAPETGNMENGTKSAYIPPPPPARVSQKAHKQYEGDDEEVDVEKTDNEMLDIDINSEVDIEQL